MGNADFLTLSEYSQRFVSRLNMETQNQNNTNLFGENANRCALYYHAIDDDLTAAGCSSICCQILSLLYWVSLENMTAKNHLILKRPNLKKISSIMDPFDTEICEIPIKGRYIVSSFEISGLFRCSQTSFQFSEFDRLLGT